MSNLKLEPVNMTPGEKAMALEKGEVFYNVKGGEKYYYMNGRSEPFRVEFLASLPMNDTNIIVWNHQWCRKAKVFICNGFELMDDRYEPGDLIDSGYVSEPTSPGYAFYCNTSNTVPDYNERGLVHRTQEGAIAHAKAMCGIDPEGE